ncbi:cytochrome-c oxidase [Bacillus sp. DTU_2020_1000418_1_SI_GHA_SEK_038]|uniref:cytochrome-c oxidase n=1 Tax=Bacillus sp. DTU_2020_1000418_1_SI_GHA_SEK_038 TaxID=3077585 RepID=UPI0028E724E2|nr:cytochrome-c oxidase [Bacillus sp. DTU_2020_1000418_1_SI_GHA_SEK_038]WNS76976.1 cytochrome-c oxidase [Bacillus sp. DTU_2020_1000418_1_SI_GHA_SEK_038]
MGIRLIKISSIYFAVGVLIGYYMSSSHSYVLTPVHVHINLLGWTSLTLAGILYHLFPNLAASKLAKWHFWLHNLGLPIMMIALAIVVTTQNEAFIPGTAVGATVTAIGILLFVFNILKNLKGNER